MGPRFSFAAHTGDGQTRRQTIDAVAQATKQGWVYLFDRIERQAAFPIEYRKYPASAVPGEATAETQPLPTKPVPFARQWLTADTLSNRTPEIHRWALEQFAKFRSEGQFFPLSLGQETVIFPGFDGGAEWGGSAFDPETGLYYVNANDLAWTSSIVEGGRGRSGVSSRQLYLTNCAGCHGEDLAGQPPQFPSLLDVRGRLSEQQDGYDHSPGRGPNGGLSQFEFCRSHRDRAIRLERYEPGIGDVAAPVDARINEQVSIHRLS